MFLKRKPKSSKWFETKIFHSLPRTFELQVESLLKKGFPNGIDEDRYCSIPYAHVLAVEREEIIGAARLFERSIRFGREIFTVGGFGGVTTKKNKRRKGVATAVLRKGMEDFGIRNFDFAFLCADVTDSAFIRLYGKVGFVPLGKPYIYRGKSGTKYVDNNGMVAPVKAMDEFKDVLSTKEILDIGLGSW